MRNSLRIAQIDHRKAGPHPLLQRLEPRPCSRPVAAAISRAPAGRASARATRRVWRRSTADATRRAAPVNAALSTCRDGMLSPRRAEPGMASLMPLDPCQLPRRRHHATPARRQSCMCRIPAGRAASSTTNSAVIANAFISPSASAARSAGGDRLRVGAHDLRDGAREQPLAHVAAQIAVGDDPDEAPLAVAHADEAETLRGHHRASLRTSASAATTSGIASSRVHDVGDPQQAAAEPPAGVEQLEIVRRKPLALHQRHRQRVAERHRHRRRGGRRQTHRARLGGARQHEHDIGGLRPGVELGRPVIAISGMPKRRV